MFSGVPGFFSVASFLFLFRNISISTVSGDRRHFFLLMRFQAKLKILSAETLEAGIARYFLARAAKFGNEPSFCFHHSSGSPVLCDSRRYLVISFLDSSSLLVIWLSSKWMISCSQLSWWRKFYNKVKWERSMQILGHTLTDFESECIALICYSKSKWWANLKFVS